MTQRLRTFAHSTLRLSAVAVLLVPLATHAKSFKDIVDTQIVPLGDKVISLFYALAFLFFLIGMLRFYFSHSSEGREKGKLFALYGIGALVVLFAVWGFVRVLLGVLDSFNT